MVSDANDFITPGEAARQSQIIRAGLDAQTRDQSAQKEAAQRAFEDAPVTDEERKRVDYLVRQAMQRGDRTCNTSCDVFRIRKAATEMGFRTRVYMDLDPSDTKVDYLAIEF